MQDKKLKKTRYRVTRIFSAARKNIESFVFWVLIYFDALILQTNKL